MAKLLDMDDMYLRIRGDKLETIDRQKHEMSFEEYLELSSF